MKTNLFKAILVEKPKDKDSKKKEIVVYVAAEDMLKAAQKLSDQLAIEEELKDIVKISEECYV